MTFSFFQLFLSGPKTFSKGKRRTEQIAAAKMGRTGVVGGH